MTKIEEVARAIYNTNAGKWSSLSWEEYAPEESSNREACLREARAAVEALREPSVAMMVAGDKRSTAVKAWISMIDVILNEKADAAD